MNKKPTPKTTRKTTRKTTKNKGGRPPKFDDKIVSKLSEAFALDCSIAEACFYAGISKVTYYVWIKKKPELVNRFEALRNKPVLLARQSVIKGIKVDPNLALKYLERKRRKEFAVKSEIDLGGQENNPLKILRVGEIEEINE